MPEQIHVVSPGDCITSIAVEYGFDWNTIWNYSANAALKALRKNPNVLLEGDEVVIPAKHLRETSKSTDQTHKFERKGAMAKIRFCLRAYGKPRPGVQYHLIVEGDTYEGKTDANGYISQFVPPKATRGELVLFTEKKTEKYFIMLGHLDPITELRGVQQRLKNLECQCEVTGEMDEATLEAIAMFESKYDIPGKGELDEALRQRILQEHGG